MLIPNSIRYHAQNNLCTLLIAMGAILVTESNASGKIDFNRDVRPILAGNCFQCHGPDVKARKAKLRLDQQEGATRDLGGYRAVSPGQPTESELMKRILSDDPEEVMPKKSTAINKISIMK